MSIEKGGVQRLPNKMTGAWHRSKLGRVVLLEGRSQADAVQQGRVAVAERKQVHVASLK